MFRPAVKEKLKLRLAIEGPSGSGKTYSSLLIARGLVGPSGRIAMIDTEKNSGQLYADVTPFDHAALDEPYTPERYIALINMASSEGYDCIIIDSMSHEWMGAGGILEMHDALPGNSYTNWAKVNPRHNKFLESILKAPCHIIATMRSKQSYALETNDKGKQEPKKLGLAPQQRDGMEYEFTAVLKVDISHQAQGDKDRTGLFPVDQWFVPSFETGEGLERWLNSGVDPLPKQKEKTFDDWQTEADDNGNTVSSLGEWYTKNKAAIFALPRDQHERLNKYVSQLKQSLIDTATVICPETDENALASECAKKKCKEGCPAII